MKGLGRPGDIEVARMWSRTIAPEEKKTKKMTHSWKKKKEKSFFSDLRNPPKRSLRRCLAMSQNLRHSQKMKNNRVATSTKVSVACPKTPSKVRVLGARDLCAPQQQRKGTLAQRRTKESERKQNTQKKQRHQWPPRRKSFTCHAMPNYAAKKSTTKTSPARKTNKS